jgi:hypothetical protein
MSEIITVDSKKYRKVDREPRVGDIIYAIADDPNCDDYRMGYLTKVYNHGELEFKDAVGDERSFYGQGHEDCFVVVEPITDLASEIEATKVKLAELEKQLAEEQRLKVGDYARVIGQPIHYQNNNIVKIVGENWDGSGMYDTQNLNGKSGDIHHPHELQKVTPEEVAEAKRKLEEPDKWTKIGRKVGEFKVGDVVKYIGGGDGCHGFKGKYEGLITRIIKDDKTTRPYLLERPKGVQTSEGTWSYGKELELIAPIESVVSLYL